MPRRITPVLSLRQPRPSLCPRCGARIAATALYAHATRDCPRSPCVHPPAEQFVPLSGGAPSLQHDR
jgi:hypothetical protein